MCMEILLHERIISLVAEKRKVRWDRKRGRAIMCSSLFFFKLFTLDSSWMQAIDYDCKGARERIQPGICFSWGLHAGTWCHHQIRGRNEADASVRDGGGDASEHLRLKQKKRMLMQGLSQQGESHQSSWSQTQSSVTILPSMKHAQIIHFYIFDYVYITPRSLIIRMYAIYKASDYAQIAHGYYIHPPQILCSGLHYVSFKF